MQDDFVHGLRIGRAEFRRTWRTYTTDPRRLVGLGMVTLLLGVALVFIASEAYSVGQSVTIHQNFSVPSSVYNQFVLLVLGLISMFTFQTVGRHGEIDAMDLILTTTSSRAVSIGLVSKLLLQFGVWAGLPALLVLGAFAIGAEAPLLFVVVPLIFMPALFFSAVMGYSLGLIIRARTNVRLTTPKTISAIGVVVLSSGAVVIFFDRFVLSESSIFSAEGITQALSMVPLAWYADFFFISIPGQSVRLGAWITAILFVLGIPVGINIATRLAEIVWFTKPSAQSREQAESKPTTPSRREIPRLFAWCRSGRIAWHIWLRNARSPDQFIQLSYIVMILGAYGISTVLVSDVTLSLWPAIAVIVGSLVAGQAFSLNPLGDEEQMLPLVMTVTMPERYFVQARVIAGVLPGILTMVVLFLGFSLFEALSSTELLLFFGFGSLLAIVSAIVGTSLGMCFPKFERVQARGGSMVLPSPVTYLCHWVFLGVLFIPWFVLIAPELQSIVVWEIETGLVRNMGVVIYAIGLCMIGIAGYKYSVHRYRTYTVN